MGCGKPQKVEKHGVEAQLRAAEETQASSRTLISAAEAYALSLQLEEQSERSLHQSFIQKLEQLQEKVEHLSTAKTRPGKHRKQASACHSIKERPRTLPATPDPNSHSFENSLEELESNAKTKMEEIRRELQSLRAMALGC